MEFSIEATGLSLARGVAGIQVIEQSAQDGNESRPCCRPACADARRLARAIGSAGQDIHFYRVT